jgi:hypothetical protein
MKIHRLVWLYRAAVTEWQPIDTAPRDGTTVIVGWDSATVWIVRAAWWRSKEDIEQMAMGGCLDADDADIGWWSYIHSVTQEMLDDYRAPTHWLPMPPPPKGDS